MERKPNPDYIHNLALASIAGQAGCVTVVLVFAALFAGLFLDSKLGTRPAFTLGLILMSIPVSLVVMVRVMLSSVGAITVPSPAGESDPAEKMLTKENDS